MIYFYILSEVLALQCYTCGSNLLYAASCDDGNIDSMVRYCNVPDPVCYYKENRKKLQNSLKPLKKI